jgi:glycosyltransferase involved in cell wall biosynthesis
MKNMPALSQFGVDTYQYQDLSLTYNSMHPEIAFRMERHVSIRDHADNLSEILVITSYPPRECGIATYSQDLIKALNNKFSNTLSIKVCAMESGNTDFHYPDEVKYILKTSFADAYEQMAVNINNDECIKIVLIQHEFGFFRLQEQAFMKFLSLLSKPVVIVFHTVLPHPDEALKNKVKNIASFCDSIIVMTNNSAQILSDFYNVPEQKVTVIAHGTHLVPHLGKKYLKKKYGLTGRKVLTTFGLLSSGKSIETTLNALPAIVEKNPDVLFLVIGKTHPEVVKEEGEKYRDSLEALVIKNKLSDHVKFINSYLTLPDLLEYLQLTDIYIFTTDDPNQAVSGTFVYAMSCGCPIISTPIPHAREVLTEDTGIIFDFRNSHQLAEGVIRLLGDEKLRRNISCNTLQKIVSTAWENSALRHAILFEKIAGDEIRLHYDLPVVNMKHLAKMTTKVGIIQFSKISQPDVTSGYTLDDNARALVASCMHLKMTGDEKNIFYIEKYLSFIKLCLQKDGRFLNYIDFDNNFTDQNSTVNLDDANGRAIWALGYLISEESLLPEKLVITANEMFQRVIPNILKMHSPRAMAFAIKGLYFYQRVTDTSENLDLIITLANRLVQMYKHETSNTWKWFESYLTYANSILPEAMLYTWLITGVEIYRDIARSSFDFLLSKIFNESGIEVISSKKWLKKGEEAGHFGEQPIDVAYTIMTLRKFYDVFSDKDYVVKMETAFNWFLGNNRLHQIMYNPCTGGCYDGMEETHVNLNQGAESTLSYLMARFTVEKYRSRLRIPCGKEMIYSAMKLKIEESLLY